MASTRASHILANHNLPLNLALYGTNMVRSLFLIVSVFSMQVYANEFCDTNSKKCEQVGSAAAWTLSIIETSTKICGANNEISQWLKANQWLTEQVKASEAEYEYLAQSQERTYWGVNSPEVLQQCSKVVNLIKNGSPLNSELR